MESRKLILMNLFAGQQWRCRHREQTCGQGLGEGEGGTTGESSMETYAHYHMRNSQWELAV